VWNTHGNHTINVGYNTMNLDITVPKKSTLKIKLVEINSKTLTTSLQQLRWNQSIYFLKGFPNKIKPRVWPIPEIELLKTGFWAYSPSKIMQSQ
jgi:hypothetical protein